MRLAKCTVQVLDGRELNTGGNERQKKKDTRKQAARRFNTIAWLSWKTNSQTPEESRCNPERSGYDSQHPFFFRCFALSS